MNPPAAKRIWTRTQFLARFTAQEVAALQVLVSQGNVTAANVWARFCAVERIHSDSPDLATMLAALVQLGVLTEPRRAAVMDFGA